MTFDVVMTDDATTRLEDIHLWFQENAPQMANKWYNGIRDSILSLEEDPERFGVADESHNYPLALREILYGVGKRKTHRIVYSVHDQKVVIRAIRHVAQRAITEDDI
jgi:hypothetical protein